MDDESVSGVFKNEVYLWLSHLTTVKPLLDQWKVDGYQDTDPVAELYKHQSKGPASLWVWIISTMGITLLSMAVILLLGTGKIVKWVPSHGHNLFHITRRLLTYITVRCTFNLFSCYHSKDLNAYEKAIDVQLEEIHVYQDGRRILCTPRSSKKELSEIPSSSCGQASSLSSHKCLQESKEATLITDHSFSYTPWKVEKTGAFFRKFSLRRSRFTQTVPYHNSRDREKRLAQIQALRARPLPPLPTISDIIKEKEQSLFFPTHLFQESPATETSKKHADFDKVRKQLLTNSQEQLCISFTSQRKNILSEFHRHRSTLQHERRNMASQELQSLRSKSFDDHYLLDKRRRKALIRRSRSLDILEENVTINTLYSELCNPSHKSTPNFVDNNGYIRLPSDDNFMKQKHIQQESKNKTRKKVKRDESLYAKIPDLPTSKTRTQIQKRPIPVPQELQVIPQNINNIKLAVNKTQEHIYQRASLIQAEKNPFYIKIKNRNTCDDVTNLY